MNDMSKHASPESLVRRSAAAPAAWAVLIGMGSTSVTYNIYHSVHTGHMLWYLALPYGVAPVFGAVFLSHLVAVHKGGWFIQSLVFAVMLGAMGLSMGAIASVVAPAAGDLRWLFGAVLDAAALIALRILLSERERTGKDAAALQAAMAGAQEAKERAVLLEGELGSLRGELAALRSAAPQALPRRSPAKRKSARGGADTQDLTTEMRALQMLDAHPELRVKGQGGELARRLGVSAAHGRRLHVRLTAEVLPPEAVPERSERGSDERLGERS
jgi:hypothetical protein